MERGGGTAAGLVRPSRRPPARGAGARTAERTQVAARASCLAPRVNRSIVNNRSIDFFPERTLYRHQLCSLSLRGELSLR
eukprot:306551-Prymnesium_polylepis.2